VGEAVVQMDQVTQQNAALVEEMAAAASSLKSQAEELVGTVAVFKLGGQAVHQGVPRTVPVRVPQAAAKPSPSKFAARPAAPKAIAHAAPAARGDEDWASF
jgi:methyl-accepting chemotaxis protein